MKTMKNPLIEEYIRLTSSGLEIVNVGLDFWSGKTHVVFLFSQGVAWPFAHEGKSIVEGGDMLEELKEFAKAKNQVDL